MNTSELSRLLQQDPAIRLLDVRTPGEFDNAHIKGAYNVPLDLLGEHAKELRSARASAVVLVCQSGLRAKRAETLLASAGMSNLHVLDGGMKLWTDYGLPVTRIRSRVSLERQVRMAAGGLVAVGSLAAFFIEPVFAWLPALIGSGLVFSGATDTCGMGMLLAKLPYNRAAACDTELIVRQFLADEARGRYMTALAWLLAAGIGLALGVLGGGGSILTVPVFTYVLGFEPKQAIAMSLPVVGIAAAAGAVSGLRRGTLPLAPALMVGVAAMAGAYGGARLATFLDGRTQLMLLAIAMLSAAIAMWLRSRADNPLARVQGHRQPLVLGAIGVAVGVLTGVVGIGGGFLIVPTLVIAGGLSMREATTASLLVIALGAGAGLAGHLGQTQLAWRIVFPFAAIASIGVVAGGALAGRISQRYLQLGFAAALVVLACYMLATR